MRVSARVIVTQWLRWEKYGCDKVISSNCKVFLFSFACWVLVFVTVASWPFRSDTNMFTIQKSTHTRILLAFLLPLLKCDDSFAHWKYPYLAGPCGLWNGANVSRWRKSSFILLLQNIYWLSFIGTIRIRDIALILFLTHFAVRHALPDAKTFFVDTKIGKIKCKKWNYMEK